MALNQKQKGFVASYLKHGNYTRAAEDAGYRGTQRSLQVVGSRLGKEPEIARAIEDGQAAAAKRHEISFDRILSNLAAMANFDVFDVVSVKNKKLIINDPKLLSAADRYAISEIKQTKEGIAVKATDKRQANLDLARLLGYGAKSAEVEDPNEKARKLLELLRAMEATVVSDGSSDPEVGSS